MARTAGILFTPAGPTHPGEWRGARPAFAPNTLTGMLYRVCKSFEIESGHMLSKHAGRCRHPHGHSRRVEIVVASESLNECDMVCDFAAIKAASRALMDRLDHALAVNSEDPAAGALRESGSAGERLVEFAGQDPTTEVLARHIYEHVAAIIEAGRDLPGEHGAVHALRPGLRLERVRVTETSSSWAEFGRS